MSDALHAEVERLRRELADAHVELGDTRSRLTALVSRVTGAAPDMPTREAVAEASRVVLAMRAENESLRAAAAAEERHHCETASAIELRELIRRVTGREDATLVDAERCVADLRARVADLASRAIPKAWVERASAPDGDCTLRIQLDDRKERRYYGVRLFEGQALSDGPRRIRPQQHPTLAAALDAADKES